MFYGAEPSRPRILGIAWGSRKFTSASRRPGVPSRYRRLRFHCGAGCRLKLAARYPFQRCRTMPPMSIPAGAEPVIPMPERTPLAIRTAVARLDVAALPRFEAEWTTATTLARDECSVMPVRHFTEKWWLWVAIRRRPDLAAQLRECERRAAAAGDLADARAASAEIGEILRAAEAAA